MTLLLSSKILLQNQIEYKASFFRTTNFKIHSPDSHFVTKLPIFKRLISMYVFLPTDETVLDCIRTFSCALEKTSTNPGYDAYFVPARIVRIFVLPGSMVFFHSVLVIHGYLLLVGLSRPLGLSCWRTQVTVHEPTSHLLISRKFDIIRNIRDPLSSQGESDSKAERVETRGRILSRTTDQDGRSAN